MGCSFRLLGLQASLGSGLATPIGVLPRKSRIIIPFAQVVMHELRVSGLEDGNALLPCPPSNRQRTFHTPFGTHPRPVPDHEHRPEGFMKMKGRVPIKQTPRSRP